MSNKTSELKMLLTRLVDSYDGYKEAAEKASQERHVRMFTDLSAERHQAALLVQDYLTRQGEDVDLDGSKIAAAHRFFMDIKDKLDDDDDEALLESIITGESELLSRYRDATKDAKYDPELLDALKKQYQKIESNLALIQAKEKAA
ncbi:MAG: hypothetical protein CMH30_06655 [Micavibrio sp.]|nr:hypothetical protein [Micavibrio sp.]|tara:strand:+ start:2502 stop:2939 length:438 start_codon:yes stop_codon:yes gene_type:complete